jgi:heterotetrameric sarcosine oxidase delta subunit
MRQWLDHIYLRENLRGPHLEWWQHHSGCRAWIKVRRDTATHEVLGAWRATEAIASAPRDDAGPGEGGR